MLSRFYYNQSIIFFLHNLAHYYNRQQAISTRTFCNIANVSAAIRKAQTPSNSWQSDVSLIQENRRERRKLGNRLMYHDRTSVYTSAHATNMNTVYTGCARRVGCEEKLREAVQSSPSGVVNRVAVGLDVDHFVIEYEAGDDGDGSANKYCVILSRRPNLDSTPALLPVFQQETGYLRQAPILIIPLWSCPCLSISPPPLFLSLFLCLSHSILPIKRIIKLRSPTKINLIYDLALLPVSQELRAFPTLLDWKFGGEVRKW